MSSTFYDMAKQAGVRPVTLVGFESMDALKVVLTTYDDWSGTETVIPSALSLIDTRGTVTLTGPGPATYTTKIVDFGTVPAGGLRLEMDDIIPSGASILYRAYGSNDYAAWSDLGAVSDGSAIPAYRFYKIEATFNKAKEFNPVLQEIRLIVAASSYSYFSTVKDCPIKGALPYLKGVSQLSSKIELDKMSSIGEIGIDLTLTRAVSDFLATGKARGKAVTVKLGFEGLSESEFLPYFVGTLQDYSFDSVKQTVKLKTRDVWKQFQRKIPADSYYLDALGKRDETKTYKLTGHVTDVILNIADALGVPERFLDRPAFAALKSAMAGAEYNVTRELTEPEEAAGLIGELAASFGLFLFPLGTGELSAVSYDAVVSGAPDAHLDARRVTCTALEAGYKDLITRIAIYYRVLPGKKGGNRDDYQNVHFSVDAAAETVSAEIKDKEWMDKWGMTSPAIQRLAQRFSKWYTTPRKTFKADQIPPRLMGLNIGSLVAVDYLQLPAPVAQWPGYSDSKTFIITSRSINPASLTVSWELQEADPLNYEYQDLPSYPAYAVYPKVTGITATERISKRNDGTIDTLIDLEWATDFRMSSVIIYVKEGDAPRWRAVVTVPTLAETGNHTYLAKDGVPYLFGFRTINAAGSAMSMDDIPTIGITPVGKSAPPSDVTGVTLTPRGDALEIKWNHVPDVDLSGYEIRKGTQWDGSPVIVSGYAGNAYPWRPTQSGDISILIKAIDTTRHYSVNAAAATLAVVGASAPTVKAAVIDNQVLLSWLPGDMGTFPLIDYEVRRGESWAAGVLVGTTAGTTQAIFETAAGLYSYWVAARTAAGTGIPSGITTAVSSPTDYVFKGARDFSLAGDKVNAIIDNGCIVLPVNATETVAEHFARVGVSAPAGQIDAGYPVYIQPGVASGSYTETLDFEAIVTGAKVVADITANPVAGAVSIATTISVSANGTAWTDYSGTTCYATNFRYVRVKIEASTANGGVIKIPAGMVRLDVRFKTLEGTATANAADVGGTTVYITENRQADGPVYFIDVESIQVTPKGTGAIVACYDFTDAADPISFKVLLFQLSGGAFVRYSGEFSFLVRGV